MAHCAAGETYSLATCGAEGWLYAWGDAEYGRLGVGVDTGKVLMPALVKGSEESGALKRDDFARLTRCCAARNHSAVVSAAGKLFTFGSGDLGMLGHADSCDRLRPFEVAALRGVVIREAALGWHHTAALDAAGRLWTCGFDGGSGVLGHDDRFADDQLQLKPRIVRALMGRGAVVEVACGAHHTVVRMACGAVLACGEGRKGALGTGASEASWVFERVVDKLKVIERLQRERDALAAALRESEFEMRLLSIQGGRTTS